MCLQSVTGVMISCFMVGFIFAKLSRPQKRSQTLMFSRNAIVCVRDNKLCIMFRVGDLRNRSHIIGGKISALVIQRKISPEGEVIPYYHRNMAVKFDEVGDDVFLIWPATIVHTIDENSPFWEMNSDDMMNLRFEIVAILEGTVESTGQSSKFIVFLSFVLSQSNLFCSSNSYFVFTIRDLVGLSFRAIDQIS